MSMKSCGLFMAFAMVLLAYWLYEPLYPNMDNLWMMRLIIAIKKILTIIGIITEKSGYASYVDIVRAGKVLIPTPPNFEYLKITDENFSGVPVRIFRPLEKSKDSTEELPALIFFHGGGWVLLDVDSYHSLTAKMAKKTGFVVVSVEYRRAPENVFPIPFTDCLTATVHLLRHGKDYGIDVSRIAISGDSAGGNLASAVGQRLTVETGLPSLKAQVLIYPALQAFNFKTPSMLTRELPVYLCRKEIVFYWLMYFQGHSDNMEKFVNNNHTSASLKNSEYGDAVDYSLLPEEFQKQLSEKPKKNFGDDQLSEAFEPTLLNPYFSPLLARQLEKLPPTLMITAEYDVLRDDGFMYVKRLVQAGVKVEHIHFKTSFHGFVSMDDSEGQERFLNNLSDYLQKTV